MTKTVRLGLLGVFRCIRVHSGVAAPFHAPGITETNGKRFEDLNVKLVPRVFLDWNDGTGGINAPALEECPGVARPTARLNCFGAPLTANPIKAEG